MVLVHIVGDGGMETPGAIVEIQGAYLPVFRGILDA